jgi:hypothetical protein
VIYKHDDLYETSAPTIAPGIFSPLSDPGGHKTTANPPNSHPQPFWARFYEGSAAGRSTENDIFN